MNSSVTKKGTRRPSVSLSTDKLFIVIELVSSIILAFDAGHSIPVAVLLVLLSLPMLLNPASVIPVLFVASWSSSISVYSLSAFYYYLAIFIMSLVIDRKMWKMVRGNQICLIAIALFAVWILITGYTSVSGDVYTSFKLFLCMVFTIVSTKVRLINFESSYKVIVYLSIIFAFLFVIRSVFFPIEFISDYGSEVTIVPGMGTNCVAQSIVMLFLFCFYNFLSLGNWKGVAFSLLYFITLFFLGSRTSLYTAVILGGILLVSGSRRSLKNNLILIGIVMIIFMLLMSFGKSFENFGRLGLATIIDNQGSGRFINWLQYSMDIIPNFPVLGIGTGIDNFISLGYYHDADNLCMDLLCETGILGLLLFIFAFVCVGVKLLRVPKNRMKMLPVCILISFLVIGIGESVFDSPMTWFFMGYSLLSVNSMNCHYGEYAHSRMYKNKSNDKIFCSVR